MTIDQAKNLLLQRFKDKRDKQLNEYRKESEFCDLTLVGKDSVEIRTHRAVVSSASNYFKDLLLSGMKESFTDRVTLNNVPGTILKTIIEFIYTGEIDEELENVEGILEYSEYFQLPELSEICSLILAESIGDNSCLKYWRLARGFLLRSLEDKCLEYILKHAENLFENSFLEDMTEEEIKLLLDEERLECREEVLFEFVKQWCVGKGSDPSESSEIFSRLIDLIRFPLMKEEFVYEKILCDDTVRENITVLKKIAHLYERNLFKAKTLKFTKHTSPRMGLKTEKLLAITSERIYRNLEKAEHISNPIKCSVGSSYAVFDDVYVLVSGGLDLGSRCQYLLPSTGDRYDFPSMEEKKMFHSSVCLDRKIYVCGGTNSNTVQIFDLNCGKWHSGPDMNMENEQFGLTTVNGSLYSVWGTSDLVEMFDPRTAEWIVASHYSFLHDCKYTRCAALNSNIYCFQSEKMFIFDVRANAFIEEPISTELYRAFVVCSFKDEVFAFGCHSGNWRGIENATLSKYNSEGEQEVLCSELEIDSDCLPVLISPYY